ncbi:MAG: TetR/AcrR family transcriptional regulator, partial [Hydrococcus sp. RM1_1_31]|nr:TetR/AcrR family transcriptional regulator [Hydrococcus sp. RM1_1_31]
MKRTKTKSAERELSPEKTEAILEGAMQEFLAHGYAATSMDKVSATAGVSKATVYSHFQNKEELFTALIHHLAHKKCHAILNLPEAQIPQEEPRIVLRCLATNMLNVTANDQQFLAFARLVIGESGRFPELARAFVFNFDQSGGQVIKRYLASRSELKLPDPEATGQVFYQCFGAFYDFQEMMYGKEVVPMERDRFIE